MTRRQSEGSETWRRLRDWDRGQAPAERLAAQLLRVENYEAVDPSHPLGGPDGLKDALCTRDGQPWIAAVYFPRRQVSFSDIKAKLREDTQGIVKNSAEGLVFITNQELRLAEREELRNLVAPHAFDLFHLERIASLLDSPPCYGMRLDFLDIEMTREEQLAFLASRDAVLLRIEEAQRETLTRLNELPANAAAPALPEPRRPFYVNPTLSNSTLAAFFGQRLHRCSSCGYGYYVRPSTFLGILGGEQTISCPNCGNVEPYSGY